MNVGFDFWVVVGINVIRARGCVICVNIEKERELGRWEGNGTSKTFHVCYLIYGLVEFNVIQCPYLDNIT